MLALLLPLLLVGCATAVILDTFADLPSSAKFDFIIVGGGTSGNVLAHRLSENPAFSVLVIEAGGSDAGNIDLIIPHLANSTGPSVDWNLTTTPQEGLNGAVVAYPRGYVLGGSSSVNFMIYTRGSKEDWDRYASVTGDKGWSWEAVLPYMFKNERFTAPSDGHNTTGQFNPLVHSFTGVTGVSLAASPSPIDPLVINFVAGRSNLMVLLNTRVTRMLNTGAMDFRTVEFVSGGKTYTLTATKEVVLSAGSVMTPSILLHSGIGSAKLLTSLGIQPVHNLPDVGQNLSDHPFLRFGFLVNSTDTWEGVERNATLTNEALDLWETTRTGVLAINFASQLGWLRVSSNPTLSNNKTFKDVDPSAGPNTPHFELLFGNGLYEATEMGNYMTMATAVVSPAARGSITIDSADPLALPIVNPNLLGSEVDLLIMREALKSALRFAAAPVFEGYIISPVGGVSAESTDAELDAFIRGNTITIWHPAGSASMSPVGANWGVVDPDLRVKGVSGLRVVDLSVVPFIPAAHPQVHAYVVAERAADLIKL